MQNKKYPVIVLAGQNEGRFAKQDEEDKKFWSKVFFDKYLSRNKSLRTIKINGVEHKIIEFELDSIRKSERISEKIIVGPEKRLREVACDDFQIIAQGSNIYENITKSFDYLKNEKKYNGKVLFIAGDVPMITEKNIDSIVAEMEKEDNGQTEIFFAVTPRNEIRKFILENKLEKYKLPMRAAFPIPLPWKLNKFGFVLKDNKGYYEKNKVDVFVAGNALFVDMEKLDSTDLETIAKMVYSSRKGLFDHRNWGFIVGNAGVLRIVKFFFGLDTLTGAEEYLSNFKIRVKGEKKTFNIKAIHASSECALDVDSQNDLERCQAYFNDKYKKS